MLDGTPELSDGFVEIAGGRQGVSQRVRDIRVLWIELAGPLEIIQCVGVVALGEEGLAQIVEGDGVLAIAFRHGGEDFFGFGASSALEQDFGERLLKNPIGMNFESLSYPSLGRVEIAAHFLESRQSEITLGVLWLDLYGPPKITFGFIRLTELELRECESVDGGIALRLELECLRESFGRVAGSARFEEELAV